MRIHRKGFPWTGSSIVFKKFKVQEPKSFPRDHAESVKYTENVRIHVICVNTVEYPFAESNVLNVITRKSNTEFLLHDFLYYILFYRITIKKFSCKNSIVIQSLGIIFYRCRRNIFYLIERVWNEIWIIIIILCISWREIIYLWSYIKCKKTKWPQIL